MSPPRKPRDADEEPVLLGQTLDFMRLLWALDHGLQSVSKHMKKKLSVTGPQRLVIRVVGRRPGISAGTLARLLHTHPSTLTGVLQRLEARGVLRREPDPADRRRWVIHLTAAGQRIDRQRAGTVEAAIRRGLRRLSDSQRDAAQQALQLLTEELARRT